MKLRFSLIAFALLTFLITSNSISAQSGGAPEFKLTDKIPVDPEVRMGTLPNGLKYYVRKNAEPENRAELRLAVNAGSILENEDQQGLAHFCEHMAFNGTENFKKSELVDYLESIGTKFGAHLNAYTSFDETVYMLQIPTDDKDIIDKGFLVLQDWASGVSFEDEEIDKERGVVIEEWRLGQGAQMRMLEKVLPVIFGGSLYAERMPIGKKDILETFKPEVLKKFYSDWYRPDLMAIVAVGDFEDIDAVEARIKKDFGGLENKKGPERTVVEIEDYEGMKVAVAKDKEAPMTSIMLQYFHDPDKAESVEDFRNYIVRNLVQEMLNSRLSELTESSDPPFMFAQATHGQMIRSKAAWTTFCASGPDKVNAAVESLIRENERAKRHGFIESELERAKKSLLRQAEQFFKEKDQTASRNFAGEYVRNFLEEEPIPGSEDNYAIHQQVMPTITLAEVNAMAKKLVRDGNSAVMIMAPDREGVAVPTEDELLKLCEATAKADVEAYTEEVDDSPLIAEMPKPGKVEDEYEYKTSEIKKWKLANGATVLIKSTDFKNDEIIFRAISPGGHSKFSDDEFESAQFAAAIIASSGIGKIDQTTLDKKLADKVVSVRPWISETHEGFRGQCSPEDLEVLLQLVHLYCTKPRQDKEAFESFVKKTRGWMELQGNSPEYHFQKTINNTFGQDHPRRRMTEIEDFDKVNLGTAFRSFYDRFSDVSDFTFVFVGNIDEEKSKKLIESYIGGIESFAREESWVDHKIKPPTGVVEKVVKKGIEPKSMVSLTFHGDNRWNSKRAYNAKAAASVLQIMLREALREDMGGTYGVRASARAELIPDTAFTFRIGWGCAPENVDTMLEVAMGLINELKKEGPSMKNVGKVKETLRREWETNQKDNRFWARKMSDYVRYGGQLDRIAEHEERYERLNEKDIQHAAKEYLRGTNYIKVVLMPENQ